MFYKFVIPTLFYCCENFLHNYSGVHAKFVGHNLKVCRSTVKSAISGLQPARHTWSAGRLYVYGESPHQISHAVSVRYRHDNESSLQFSNGRHLDRFTFYNSFTTIIN